MMKLATLAVAAAAVVSVAACSPPSEHDSTLKPSVTSSAAPAPFNDADVMFLQMMYPHHAQAVDMAKLVPTRSQNQQVKDLAATIENAQAPEMARMQALLVSFGKPAPSATMDHPMNGVMTPQQMTTLAGLSGAAFDTMWLQMMIEHHQGAVTMSQDELRDGTNADVKAMAQSIVTAQQGEIATMQGMLTRK